MEKKISSNANQTVQDWELINPEGVKLSEVLRLNPHPATLKGKTIMLTWNHKPNGDVFLNRIAELLTKEAKDVKIIKLWELRPFTAVVSHGQELSQRIARAVLEYKPDLAINGQGD